MQSSCSFNDLHSWPEIQVVRVSQDDLGTQFDQLALLNGFHTPLCSNRHEHRRLDRPMRGFQNAGTRFSVGCEESKVQSNANPGINDGDRTRTKNRRVAIRSAESAVSLQI
jgi:hypothetical protein